MPFDGICLKERIVGVLLVWIDASMLALVVDVVVPDEV